MSETLWAILGFWVEGLPPTFMDSFRLPFNLESFCRENDAKLADLRRQLAEREPAINRLVEALEACMETFRYPPTSDPNYSETRQTMDRATGLALAAIKSVDKPEGK